MEWKVVCRETPSPQQTFQLENFSPATLSHKNFFPRNVPILRAYTLQLLFDNRFYFFRVVTLEIALWIVNKANAFNLGNKYFMSYSALLFVIFARINSKNWNSTKFEEACAKLLWKALILVCVQMRNLFQGFVREFTTLKRVHHWVNTDFVISRDGYTKT